MQSVPRGWSGRDHGERHEGLDPRSLEGYDGVHGGGADGGIGVDQLRPELAAEGGGGS